MLKIILNSKVCYKCQALISLIPDTTYHSYTTITHSIIPVLYIIAIAPKRRAATPNKFELIVEPLLAGTVVLVAAGTTELSVE
jgi:hypothetical protein